MLSFGISFVVTFGLFFRDHGSFLNELGGNFWVVFETMVPFGMPFVVIFGSFLETVVSFGMPPGILLGCGGSRDAGFHNTAQIPKLHVLSSALVKALLLVGFGKTDGSEL